MCSDGGLTSNCALGGLESRESDHRLFVIPRRRRLRERNARLLIAFGVAAGLGEVEVAGRSNSRADSHVAVATSRRTFSSGGQR